MGMFDTVLARCPVCREINEYQTKSGFRVMDEQPAYNVDLVMALDMIDERDRYYKDENGLLTCEHCKVKLFPTVVMAVNGKAVLQLHEYIETRGFDD